jgi:hypothetical protein
VVQVLKHGQPAFVGKGTGRKSAKYLAYHAYTPAGGPAARGPFVRLGTLKWFEQHTRRGHDVFELLWTFNFPGAIPRVIRKGGTPFAVTITGELSPRRTPKTMKGPWRHSLKVTANGLTVTGPNELCPYFDADHMRHLLRDTKAWRLALANGEPA